jgi:uncharacterized DUF497 family protein
MALKFEWDEKKNLLNRKKHGLWFEEALSVFDDHLGKLFYDSENSTDESRFILIGINRQYKLLVVVHILKESENLVRIISARPATKKERLFYEERI